MHANLMRAARKELAIDKRVTIIVSICFETLKHPKRGQSVTRRINIANRHAQTLGCMARNGSIHHTAIVRNAPMDKSQVMTINFARLNVFHKRLTSLVRLSGKHQAACVHIQTMHNTQTVIVTLHVA